MGRGRDQVSDAFRACATLMRETLDQLLPGPIEITRCLRLAVSLATSLDGLHKRELIHKDVKRESEIQALLAAFERVVVAGQPELVLVSGYSGVGQLPSSMNSTNHLSRRADFSRPVRRVEVARLVST